MECSQPPSGIAMNAQKSQEQTSHDKYTQPGDREMQPDAEKQCPVAPVEAKKSVYAGLGWLDRLLALWILLAIIIGILLGNFVDSVGPALQRGKFVDVSVPIG
jgi:ACR3 family arsenite transporter